MARILVVDDDPDFVEIMRTILLTEGYEVVTATSGDQALEQVRSARPDLILLDVMMSTILDGVNVSQELYDDADLRDIPLVMISSIASTDHADMFPTDQYVHLDRWLSKPVQPQELLKTVKHFVG